MAQTGALDHDVLKSLRELGGDSASFVEELYSIYLNTAPARIEKIRAAVKSGNSLELRREAHSLKSSSANIGAMAISELCARLEQIGQDGDRQLADVPANDGSASLVDALVELFGQVAREIGALPELQKRSA